MIPFIDKLRAGDRTVGSVVTLPSPEISEILSRSGFDFLIVDAEHSALDVVDVQRHLIAADGGCPVLVRVPSLDEIWIKKYLDTGPQGIIVPMVNTVEQAEKAVRFSKYPPVGARSVGMARAHAYGKSFQEYIESANDTVALVIQIEHVQAVSQVHEILAVPGIDAVFIGPYDLSGSMGKIGKVHDEDVQSQVGIVRDACIDTHIPVGIFGVDVTTAKALFNQGYSFVVVGMDAMFLSSSAENIMSSLKDSH